MPPLVSIALGELAQNREEVGHSFAWAWLATLDGTILRSTSRAQAYPLERSKSRVGELTSAVERLHALLDDCRVSA